MLRPIRTLQQEKRDSNKCASGNAKVWNPLCYAQLGGVRPEDVVTVTPNGARNLAKFQNVLEV